MKKLFNLWLPPVMWALIIFYFSSLPTIPTSKIFWQDFLLKKTAHIMEYGIFTVLIYRAFKESGIKKKNAAILSLLIVLIYGITDEYHQSFTPGREPRVRDVIIDTTGGTLGILVLWKILPKLPSKVQGLAKKFELV